MYLAKEEVVVPWRWNDGNFRLCRVPHRSRRNVCFCYLCSCSFSTRTSKIMMMMMIMIRSGFRERFVLVCLGSTNVTRNLNSTNWLRMNWIEFSERDSRIHALPSNISSQFLVLAPSFGIKLSFVLSHHQIHLRNAFDLETSILLFEQERHFDWDVPLVEPQQPSVCTYGVRVVFHYFLRRSGRRETIQIRCVFDACGLIHAITSDAATVTAYRLIPEVKTNISNILHEFEIVNTSLRLPRTSLHYCDTDL